MMNDRKSDEWRLLSVMSVDKIRKNEESDNASQLIMPKDKKDLEMLK